MHPWRLWLSVIAYPHSIAFGMAAIMVALNFQGKRSIVQAIAVVVNIGFNLLVVRWFQIPGVAWVYVCTEMVLVIGYAWVVLRHFMNWRRLGIVLEVNK